MDEILKSWIGVKFKLQGRSKESGCDCIGLILGVGEEVNFISKTGKSAHEIDELTYNLHSDKSKIKDALDKEFYPATNDTKNPIILLDYGSHLHLGILTSDDQIIHSHIMARAVISNHYDDFYKQKVIAKYSYFNNVR